MFTKAQVLDWPFHIFVNIHSRRLRNETTEPADDKKLEGLINKMTEVSYRKMLATCDWNNKTRIQCILNLLFIKSAMGFYAKNFEVVDLN